jgi:cytosine/adenosine deaminase-related metal-dependent hydrolase
MVILNPNYIYIDGKFQKSVAVAFNSKIEAIGSLEELKSKYPNSEIIEGGENSVLYAGFINTHLHLEFSANQTTLKYGSFMSWLDSVIENREKLIAMCDNSVMERASQEMLRSGITTFGAISSFGAELEICKKTPQKVIFFNELIGSNMAYVDMLYSDFLARLEASKEATEYGITPAIAIHSPYSVHPIVLNRALEVAKNENLKVSAHLLEAPSEREWLENGSGEFLKFFKKYFNTTKPVTSIDRFLESFNDIPTHFTHVVHANERELDYIAEHGHSIAHCPRSNRLLGCGRLSIEKLIKKGIPFSIATDGLSSNNSLNIFDELRSALMMHYKEDLHKLSKLLIDSVTSTPAKIFNLNSGEIKEGKDADLALITLPNTPISIDDIPLYTILHTKEVSRLYIDGVLIL